MWPDFWSFQRVRKPPAGRCVFGRARLALGNPGSLLGGTRGSRLPLPDEAPGFPSSAIFDISQNCPGAFKAQFGAEVAPLKRLKRTQSIEFLA
ncbi:MAG TPA: hypothetical protein VID77_14370, partial [Stellaceae bacterium]|jgi:hypothetical protein